MKSRRFSVSIAFALSLCLVFIFVLSSLMKTGTSVLAQTDTAALAPTPNAPFKGKVVVVTFAYGSNQNTLALEQVQVHQLGDRYFLVGKGVDEGNIPFWIKGQMTWVPMNSVTTLSEMDSVEEMRAKSRASQKGVPFTSSATQP